ncbi:class I SAM-dependent DNA methyltransferase [Pseudoroseomonas wenyumeiae]
MPPCWRASIVPSRSSWRQRHDPCDAIPVGQLFRGALCRRPRPWKFRSSPYEAAKYKATLAALPRARYGSVLEIGCSIGVLTRMLAPRCDRLLALDGSARALADARRHCAGLAQVSFAQREIPRQWPRGRHDLILFSEVLYYLDEEDLARTATLALRALRPGGEVLLVHWTGTTDYPFRAMRRWTASWRRRGRRWSR